MCSTPNANPLTDNAGHNHPQRLTIWGLEPRFHCSVVGTCLTLKELQKLGNKIGISNHILRDSYHLHSAFVSIVATQSMEAKLINKHLNKKYSETILHLKHLHKASAISTVWKKSLATGNIDSAFWALVTHPHTSTEFSLQILGKVHMLSHLSGEKVRVDMLELAKLRQVLPELERKLKVLEKKSQTELRSKDKLVQQLNIKVNKLNCNELQLKQTNIRLQEIKQQYESNTLNNNNEQLTKKLVASQNLVRRAEQNAQEWKSLASVRVKDYDQLSSQISLLKSEQKTVEKTLQHLLTPPCIDSSSKNIDLCNRCILFVGGRNRQSAHFRAVVEKLNGRFLHHDGGVEESSQRLSALVSQSDAVLCPLDCVSHDAMNRIKRDCKHQGKSLQLLRQSGLATFTHGLHQIVIEQQENTH